MRRTKTYVVVEPGSTHQGELYRMLGLIDAVSGASAFKSQWVSDAEALVTRRRAPEYRDSYRLLQYPLEWHALLRDAARRRDMDYGCSVYLPGDAARVAPFVDFLKISSFEALDGELIEEAKATGLRVIVSTGMQSREDVHQYDGVNLLHCVSAYPAPLASLHLAALYYGDGTCPFYGFSDHSRDVRVGAWAVVALGHVGGVIEVHVRGYETPQENRDFAVAFTPDEFLVYLANIADVEAALGSSTKRVQEAERPLLKHRVVATLARVR